jgi:hypothetical protein
VLGELALEGPEGTVVRMRADGTVLVEEQPVGVLHPDGRYVGSGDDLVAELRADGALVGRGRHLATIDRDAVAVVPSGDTLRFTSAGVLEWNVLASADLELRLDPADTPARRAAMVLVVLFLV